MLKEKIIEILKSLEPDNPDYEPNFDYIAGEILSLISDTIKECVGEGEDTITAGFYATSIKHQVGIINRNQKRQEILLKLKEKGLIN